MAGAGDAAPLHLPAAWRHTTFLIWQVLAMLHRSIYPQHGDDFYTEHANNPQSALGLVCSGGTLANISAMCTGAHFGTSSFGEAHLVIRRGPLSRFGEVDLVIRRGALSHSARCT